MFLPTVPSLSVPSKYIYYLATSPNHCDRSVCRLASARVMPGHTMSERVREQEERDENGKKQKIEA